MKQVMEQYAAVVIAGFLTIILFTIIVQGIYGQNMGISKIFGLILQDSIGEKAIIENGALEAYILGTAIVLKEKNVYAVTNQEICIEDCYEAKNSYGDNIPLFFEAAWNQKWEAIEVDSFEEGRKISIAEEGAYWIQVYTMDKNKKKHSWMVSMLVNER